MRFIQSFLLIFIYCSSAVFSQYDIQKKDIPVNALALLNSDKSQSIFSSGYAPDVYQTPVLRIEGFTDAPFYLMGLNFQNGNLKFENVSISVYYRTAGNREWKKEDFIFSSHAPDGEPVIGSEPLFLPNDAAEYYLTLESKGNFTFRTFNIVIINPGKTTQSDLEEIKKVSESSAESDGMAYPKPPVVTRTQWGSPVGQGTNCSSSYTTVTHLIVHHSAGANSASDWAAVVRSIYTYHTQSNGWCDVGYNYLIDPNGVIYEGRGGGDNVVGAHFCGYNGNCMGVCMLGTYNTIAPPNNAIASLSKILAWKADQRSIDPLGVSLHGSSGLVIDHISGHRQGCSTDCPGTVMFNLLPTVRLAVKSLLQSIPPKVESQFPVNSTSGFQAYKSIKLTFSSPMDTATVRNAISFTPAAPFSLVWTGITTLEVKPAPFWGFSTSYQFKIDTTAKNIFGATIDGDGNGTAGDPFIINFSTVAPDNQAPVLVNYFPVANSVVTVYSEFKLKFNEEISSVANKIFLLDSAGAIVNLAGLVVNVTDDKTELLFRPASLLKTNTAYTLKLLSSISDMYGNQLGTDLLIQFRTDLNQYTEGTVIDRFEFDAGWIEPKSNSASVNIDTLDTKFFITAARKRSGQTSGQLNYKFNSYSQNNLAVLDRPTTLDLSGKTSLGFWVFGDLSYNDLIFRYSNGSGNIMTHPQTWKLNFYGWKFINYSLSSDMAGFKGIAVKNSDPDVTAGSVYLDNLQTNGDYVQDVDDNSAQTPRDYTLYQNYPNPFNPSTLIRFYVPVRSEVSLDVYDVNGALIQSVLSQKEFEPGQHSVLFDGRQLSSGIYFFTMRSGGKLLTNKMLLLK
ncbi:MAG: Ig-like domain-containing protein [Ignavibacteriaceae bacterium]|nr:Ig-like domain-containing protein [Ignavibacteriaceae bacterium]